MMVTGAIPSGIGGGVLGGALGPPAPPSPPKPPSARPRNAGWKCSFPPESDKAAVDAAVVLIRVTVSPDGRAESVVVLKDPGLGFGREATKCAMTQLYDPARDAQNNPVRGTTAVFRVRFAR